MLFSAETAGRVVREVRVTKVKENTELAFYAAEAGFNRVRARMIRQATEADILALNARVENLYLDAAKTEPAGQYILAVEKNPDGSFWVQSTGTFGPGTYSTKRIVAGIVQITGTKVVAGTTLNTVSTQYTP
jgi:glutamate 5-kinase